MASYYKFDIPTSPYQINYANTFTYSYLGLTYTGDPTFPQDIQATYLGTASTTDTNSTSDYSLYIDSTMYMPGITFPNLKSMTIEVLFKFKSSSYGSGISKLVLLESVNPTPENEFVSFYIASGSTLYG